MLDRGIPTRVNERRRRRGFTLVEMLMVVSIIALLIAMALPALTKVKSNAAITRQRSQVKAIEGACETYFNDFLYYPGPMTNDWISANLGPDGTHGTTTSLNTQSENLVVGLLGAIGTTQPSANAYYKPKSGELMDAPEVGWADTTIDYDNVFEFADMFNPKMPILYYRAFPGATGVLGAAPSGAAVRQYDFLDNLRYVNDNTKIGNNPHRIRWYNPSNAGYGPLARMLTDPRFNVDTGYWGWADTDSTSYGNATIATAVKQDKFVLITAGPNRTWGTKDDLCNFELVVGAAGTAANVPP